MVDTTGFTPEEEERLIQAQAAGLQLTPRRHPAAATDEQASSEQVEASAADETS